MNVKDLCVKQELFTQEELDIIIVPHEMTNVGISDFKQMQKRKKE